MIDHDADELLAFARELIANDPQGGFGYGDGEVLDRNTELIIGHPFAVDGIPPDPPTSEAAPPRDGGVLPATGLPSNLTVGGALLLAGAMGVRHLRDRATEADRPHG